MINETPEREWCLHVRAQPTSQTAVRVALFEKLKRGHCADASARGDLGLIVDLAGATGATVVSFVAPAVLYMRLFPQPRAAPLRLASAAVAAFGLCTGSIGVALAIADSAGSDEAYVHHPEIYRNVSAGR